MKTLIRCVIWLCVAGCILCVGADFWLRTISKRPQFKAYALAQVQKALGREVSADNVRASLYGLELTNFQIAEEGGFQNGVFLDISRARVYFALSHLLHFHLKVKKVELQRSRLNLIRYPDGTFNFESFSDSSAPEESETDDDGNVLLSLFTIRTIDLLNLTVSYEDQQTSQTDQAENIFLTVHRFEFDDEFPFELNTTLSYQTEQQTYTIPLTLRAVAYLNNLDFSEAYVKIIDLNLKYDSLFVQLNGEVSQWNSPVFSLNLSAKKINSLLFREWVDFPAFELPSLSFSSNGKFDTQTQTLEVGKMALSVEGASAQTMGRVSFPQLTHQAQGKLRFDFEKLITWLPDEWQQFILKQGTVNANVQVQTGRVAGDLQAKIPAGDISLNGNYQYAQNKYDVQADFQVDMDETSAYFPRTWKELNLQGDIDGSVQTNGQQVEAKLYWAEGGAFYPTAGHFSNVYATFTAQESMDFKTGSATLNLRGDLNQGPFTADISVNQTPQLIKGIVKAYSKRIALPPAPPSNLADTAEEFVTDTSLKPTDKIEWTLPPIDLVADIKIDSLDAPYLYATDVSFTSDLQGITPLLDNTHGVLKLSLGKGTILDLYRLTNANPLTKVLFLSLNIVGKVFNSLNVFSVLNGLKKGVISAVRGNKKTEETEVRMVVQPMLDENGKPVEMLVPYTEQKVKGQQHFDKFETEIKFNDGLASIRKGTFVSDMMSMRLDGTTNFNNGDVALKVHAAPGKHQVNGVMPLTVNISGTVAEPKGSMSMLGSVTSLVTQGVTKNVVSRNVHKGVKSFFRLFKKKGKEEEFLEEEMPMEETSDETETVPLNNDTPL